MPSKEIQKKLDARGKCSSMKGRRAPKKNRKKAIKKKFHTKKEEQVYLQQQMQKLSKELNIPLDTLMRPPPEMVKQEVEESKVEELKTEED